jgi:DNA-binding IclR family transcriptional regulator
MSVLPAQPNQSLLEGIEVLLAVVQHGDSVGVRELGRELGMTPTRVQRYLATLAHIGLMERTLDRRYGPGPGIHALSALSLSASGLAGRAVRVLPAFEDLGMIVALGVLWRHTVNYLYFNTPGIPVSESLGIQHSYPARHSSIGMLMLAWKDEAYLAEHFPEEHIQLAPELEKVREQGHAIVHQTGGDSSVAVPVGSPPIAGLAVSGKIRKGSLPKLISRMEQAAEQLVVK